MQAVILAQDQACGTQAALDFTTLLSSFLSATLIPTGMFLFLIFVELLLSCHSDLSLQLATLGSLFYPAHRLLDELFYLVCSQSFPIWLLFMSLIDLQSL